MIPTPTMAAILAALNAGRRLQLNFPFGLAILGSAPAVIPGLHAGQELSSSAAASGTGAPVKLIGILFCLPTTKLGKDEICPNLDYFHHRSGANVDFFCVGYRTETSKATPPSPSGIEVNGVSWAFSNNDFNNTRAEVESSTNWRFSGETDLLLLVAREGSMGHRSLDYSSAIVCNLEELVRDGAVSSVRAFFEQLFQFGDSQPQGHTVWKLSDKLGLKGGAKFLEESVLGLLPESAKKQFRATRHFAVRNVSRAV